MNTYTIQNKDRTYTRISKAKARKLWGKEVIALCPVNLRPGFPWNPDMVLDVQTIQDGLTSEYDFDRQRYDFDTMVRSFEFYNCSCNETGTYTAFYAVN